MLQKWMKEFLDSEMEKFANQFETSKVLVIPDETFMKEKGEINTLRKLKND